MKKPDSDHLSRLTALGCVVCRNEGYGETPAEAHHIRDMTGLGSREEHLKSLPLCHPHHRTGGYGVAFHAGRKIWEKNFGTQLELLNQVHEELGIIGGTEQTA